MLEYVWVNEDGKSLEYFDTHPEAIEFLCKVEGDNPGIANRWMLLAYDEMGKAREPEYADNLMKKSSPS